MIILDTNVLSELMRAKPTILVLKWFAAQPSAGLFTTTLTQAEIFYGLSLLPEGRRRDDLFAAAQPIFEVELAGRILSFDQDAAMAYADIAASRRRAGQPISQIDGQIAAITASRGARLATRNVRDFVDCGIVVVDPWMMPN
ncbi:type II toxin-antitoxin system VapC family toxin [Methylobacterium sp. WL18]|uniref:type II toxin-antitoxin system VapC family toxin n=1 Tax=Methylobacterium sp. WL18 TaxID=2603897 RepID=UPI0011C87EEB|nr:type II toxin-antitoxin system VapC family toxin [Methylobacterium sp. WL18]TXN73875.1 type II toxin-antitoxin system VapC family toxin [Methylobacterium sp. WL18]